MNALATTFADLTVALTPRPLEVRIVTTSHTKKGRFYTVFVGHGSDGEYYEVNEHVLGRLRAGPGRAVQIIPDLVPAVIHDLQHRLIAEMCQNGNENDKVED